MKKAMVFVLINNINISAERRAQRLKVQSSLAG
jgi:hypothetical protein